MNDATCLKKDQPALLEFHLGRVLRAIQRVPWELKKDVDVRGEAEDSFLLLRSFILPLESNDRCFLCGKPVAGKDLFLTVETPLDSDKFHKDCWLDILEKAQSVEPSESARIASYLRPDSSNPPPTTP
jgi:hypothetical protein